MSRREQKRLIHSMLKNESIDQVKGYFQKSDTDHNGVIHHLFSALCSTHEICKWHAVTGFGIVVPAVAAKNLENARIIMRRFLWSLNDESGGIGWGVPESMAEVMVKSDTLFMEYVHMLVSYLRGDGPELLQDGNYLELPALQQGLLWGVVRLLGSRKDAMLKLGVEEDLFHYLESSDPRVRALAVWSLVRCGSNISHQAIQRVMDEDLQITVYLEERLHEITLSQLVRKWP